jgi:hypothetical protein
MSECIHNLPCLINSGGLILNIIGALLLWRFGLPEPISRTGEIYLITGQTNESEIRKGRKYDRYSHAGVILLIAGFFCQLVAGLL